MPSLPNSVQIEPLISVDLAKKGWWNEEKDKALVLECRQQVRDALGKAEKQLKPGIVHLFTDVYGILISLFLFLGLFLIHLDTIPQNLQEQKAELEQHLRKYPDEYPVDIHSKSL